MKRYLNFKKKIIMIFLFLGMFIIFMINNSQADGWDSSKSSHSVLYSDTITSKTDSSSVNIADELFVTGDFTTFGNVGVGLTNPQAKLDVSGKITATSYGGPVLRMYLVTDDWNNGCDQLNIGNDCFGHNCENCFVISPSTIYGTIYNDASCTQAYPLHGTCSIADCKVGITSSNCGTGCPGYDGTGGDKRFIYYGDNTRFQIICWGN